MMFIMIEDKEQEDSADISIRVGDGMLRRRSRLRAVQGIYMMQQNEDLTVGEIWSDTKDWFLNDDSLEDEKAGASFERLECNQDLFHQIMLGAMGLEELTEEFLLENLSSSNRGGASVPFLLKCILQCALFELSLVVDSDSQRIIVADYVAVCDSFFGQKEVSLLNGLLSKEVFVL